MDEYGSPFLKSPVLLLFPQVHQSSGGSKRFWNDTVWNNSVPLYKGKVIVSNKHVFIVKLNLSNNYVNFIMSVMIRIFISIINGRVENHLIN